MLLILKLIRVKLYRVGKRATRSIAWNGLAGGTGANSECTTANVRRHIHHRWTVRELPPSRRRGRPGPRAGWPFSSGYPCPSSPRPAPLQRTCYTSPVAFVSPVVTVRAKSSHRRRCGSDPERGSWALGVLTPWKYVGRVRVCFEPLPPLKTSHSFIQNCCWITLQVSHHHGRKTYVKDGR